MKLPITFALLMIGGSLLSGCASTLRITYDSDPPGAVLYQGQQRFGYTPVSVQYQVSAEEKKLGYKVVEGTLVRWASGATAEMSSFKADLNQRGFSQYFSFQRPEGVPGRETDVQFALELDRTRALQRQAAAQEEQARAQRRQAAAQEEQAATQRRQEERERADRNRNRSPSN